MHPVEWERLKDSEYLEKKPAEVEAEPAPEAEPEPEPKASSEEAEQSEK
jgi:hypothetical protein